MNKVRSIIMIMDSFSDPIQQQIGKNLLIPSTLSKLYLIEKPSEVMACVAIVVA